MQQSNSLPASLPESVSRLENQRCIIFSGPDTESFLQGQFTNDVAGLSAGAQQLNGYCNPKGRTLCVFRLARDAERWLMILPADLADNMLKRLMLYRMRAKVMIEMADNQSLYGVINAGPGAGSAIRAFIDSNPHWDVDPDRTLVLSSEDRETAGDEGQWVLSEILSGVPQVSAETTEQFIPQHINLDLIGAVSFSKGCYPGQEIVARLRYLGKMKQRMIGGRLDRADLKSGTQPEVPLPGTPVFCPAQGVQKVGQIVRASVVGDSCYLLLTAPAALIEQGELRLGTTDGAEISRFPLPYPITLEKA